MSANTNPRPEPELQSLSGLGLDPFEAGLLSVMRHLLHSFRAPETQAWHTAYSIAAERWGDNTGFPVAHRLAKFLKAVLRIREDQVAFNDPFHVEGRDLATADEVALLNVLRFMRRDDTRAARQAVDTLTRGLMDPDVIRTGLDFANRFPADPNGADRRPSRPALRVVS